MDPVTIVFQWDYPTSAQKASAAPEHPQQELDLQPELLQHVLTYVPLQQRLQSCALVCKAWASATASVTAQLALADAAEPQIRRLQPWLQACGDLVNSLSVQGKDGLPRPLLELPCNRLTRLTTLELSYVHVSLQLRRSRSRTHTSRARALLSSSAAAAEASGSRAAGVVDDGLLLPQLQRVKLHHCRMQLPHLVQLCHHSCLTHLYLEGVQVPDRSGEVFVEEVQEQVAEQVEQALKQLPRLQELVLHDLPLQLPNLSSLSRMTGLQQCSVRFDLEQPLGDLLHWLPAGLSSLWLWGCNLVGLPADLASATRMTSLQHLQLVDLSLDPRVLAYWTRLTRLDLQWVDLQLGAPDNHLQQQQADDAGGAALRSLLSALGQMTQLRHLQFADVMCGATDDVVVAQQQHSSLTASPHLTELHMTVRTGAPLPSHALQQMLPAGKQLQHLRTLHLRGHPFWDEPASADCVGTADLRSIAASCPSLSSLHLLHVVQRCANLEPLTQLSQLVELHVSGPAFGYITAARVLAQLTGLQMLHLCNVKLPLHGLQLLTSLQRLTRLELHAHTLRLARHQHEANCLVLEADPQAPAPDVWQQIRDLQTC